jgi:hypothetical protein
MTARGLGGLAAPAPDDGPGRPVAPARSLVQDVSKPREDRWRRFPSSEDIGSEYGQARRRGGSQLRAGPRGRVRERERWTLRRADSCRSQGASAGAASFWIRRMAHETVIHRIDAELALAEPSAAIAPALAADGIDEVLTVILTHETRQWTDQYATDLTDWGPRWLLVSAGPAQWRITMRPNGTDAMPLRSPPASAAPPAAAIHGDPDSLLRWAYNRGRANQVITTGDVRYTVIFADIFGSKW